MRTKDDPIDYKKDFFGLESYLCDSFGQLQGEAMSKIDSNWSKKLEVRSEKKKIPGWVRSCRCGKRRQPAQRSEGKKGSGWGRRRESTREAWESRCTWCFEDRGSREAGGDFPFFPPLRGRPRRRGEGPGLGSRAAASGL